MLLTCREFSEVTNTEEWIQQDISSFAEKYRLAKEAKKSQILRDRQRFYTTLCVAISIAAGTFIVEGAFGALWWWAAATTVESEACKETGTHLNFRLETAGQLAILTWALTLLMALLDNWEHVVGWFSRGVRSAKYRTGMNREKFFDLETGEPLLEEVDLSNNSVSK